ncbi:MAG: hypothetical protein H5T64_09700 [Chloroflexi bacterium]|nr:hypothetical protein [Chloroflexota bacterium]
MEECSPASEKWATALSGLIIAFAVFALLANSLTFLPSVSAYPQAQATPTTVLCADHLSPQEF